MESGAKGCEVVVSGKLRGQRAKSMKFVDGLMIHSGNAVNDYIKEAVRHVLLRQGKSLTLTLELIDTFLSLIISYNIDNIVILCCVSKNYFPHVIQSMIKQT